ncbi:hypothetical protein Syun_001560 [Stephania yunnanensis]|uniref:Uncharacterized protein n=1 Tax=Stephania yunnanensis TaxID=152371 RepID=A0AAP0Q6K6_9MAGN
MSILDLLRRSFLLFGERRGQGFSITLSESEAFFTRHPQFAKNAFFITGESYARRYIPAFAARVLQVSKAKEGLHVNLKFLNQKPVRHALGVSDIEFISCSPAMCYDMLMDWMRNMKVGIEIHSCTKESSNLGSNTKIVNTRTVNR